VIKRYTLALGSALLASCAAVGPNYQALLMTAPARFHNAPSADEQQALSVALQWWKGFGDPILDQLIEASMRRNADVRVAQARIREARAALGETRYGLYPSGSVEVGYERSRSSGALTQPGAPRTAELYTAGFDAAWEIDLFGGTRRSIEAASAAADAAQAGYGDTLVSLSAEVATNYLLLRGTQTRLRLATANAQSQLDTANLAEIKRETGRGNALDSTRAFAQYEATRASLPLLEADIERAVQRLATLSGGLEPAMAGRLRQPQELPAAPAVASIPAPQDLLRRRADVRVAERSLAALVAQVGVETADLYPRITIVGSVASISPTGSGLGKGRSESYSILPSVSWGVFQLHIVRARIEQADARAEAALALFEQVVLVALEDTETALNAYAKQVRRRDALLASANGSERAAKLARQRFREGVASSLDVLDADRSLLSAQDELAQGEQATAVAVVALFKALGGGWPGPSAMTSVKPMAAAAVR
jgi:outer membrane protein, multidrug efflux system